MRGGVVPATGENADAASMAFVRTDMGRTPICAMCASACVAQPVCCLCGDLRVVLMRDLSRSRTLSSDFSANLQTCQALERILKRTTLCGRANERRSSCIW